MKNFVVLGFISFLLIGCILSGCHFARDAGQVTGMAKEFAEEGRVTAKRIEIIKSNAKAVDYSDGINQYQKIGTVSIFTYFKR